MSEIFQANRQEGYDQDVIVFKIEPTPQALKNKVDGVSVGNDGRMLLNEPVRDAMVEVQNAIITAAKANPHSLLYLIINAEHLKLEDAQSGKFLDRDFLAELFGLMNDFSKIGLFTGRENRGLLAFALSAVGLAGGDTVTLGKLTVAYEEDTIKKVITADANKKQKK